MVIKTQRPLVTSKETLELMLPELKKMLAALKNLAIEVDQVDLEDNLK